MTGYGKAEALLSSGTLTLEIRTLNGKSADINIKTSLLPKDKELEVRKLLADKLVRGTIDLYVTFEPAAGNGAHSINEAAFREYMASTAIPPPSPPPSSASPTSWMPARPTSSAPTNGPLWPMPWTAPWLSSWTTAPPKALPSTKTSPRA